MRKLIISAVLAAGSVGTLSAQAMPWVNEIGLNLNYTVATVDDQDVTMIGFPSGTSYIGLGGVGALYGVIPINARFAVEPSLGATDQSIVGTSLTTVNFGGRLLYSAWRGLYVGAGPSLELFKTNGQQYSTWGFNVGVGYRTHLTGSLTGRAEVYYESMGEHEYFGNETSTAMGLKIGLGLTPSAAPTGRRMGNDAMWPLAIGFQGGYSHLSSDAGDISGFSLPGTENAIVAGGLPLPGVAPLFVQIPVGERLALEPSLGYSSVDVDGSTKVSMQSLGVRALYAFNRHLYGGVSFDYVGYGGDLDIDATTGYGVAGGIRFPLLSGLTGRTELTFRKFSADDGFLGDFTNTAVSFAVSAPLK